MRQHSVLRGFIRHIDLDLLSKNFEKIPNSTNISRLLVLLLLASNKLQKNGETSVCSTSRAVQIIAGNSVP